MPKTNTLPKLSTWLFKRPAIFAVVFFAVSILLTFIYSAILSGLNLGTENLDPWSYLMIIAFILTAYFTIIKKLPSEDINQEDFVAISNGTNLITILTAFISMIFVIGFNPFVLKMKMMQMYVHQPVTFWVLVTFCIFVYLYIAGMVVSGLYAKYKRAVTLGISKWKIILSWPFGFLLTWTPGYFAKGKNTKTNLQIKSNLYNRFNKWTLATYSNTLFVFLFLLLFTKVIVGVPALILTVILLLFYGIWKLKFKENFLKVLNRGYAESAVAINIIMLLLFIIIKG